MNFIPPLPKTEPHQHFVLHGVDWKTYEKFLEAFGERHVRLTYDGENLEFTAPTWNHEWLKGRIRCAVPFIGTELDIDVQPGGSTTFRREEVNRGIEADDCFYIGENARQMAGLRVLDLSRDPSPDLVLEVDISRSCLDRAEITRLKVPEIWIADTQGIQPYRLNEEGNYVPVERSAWFPALPLDEFFKFLLETQDVAENRVIPLVQKWAWGICMGNRKAQHLEVGQFVLHRFNGDEIYRVKSATIDAAVDEDDEDEGDGVELSFYVDTLRKPLKTLPDTAKLAQNPNADVCVTLKNLDIDKLVGRRFSVPTAYSEEKEDHVACIYYCEHNDLDRNVVRILEREANKFLVHWTGKTCDVNYYDGSKPATKVEIKAWFTFKGMNRWATR